MGGRGREWEGAGAGAGAGAGMSGGPCSRWHRWTGLGWWLPHCMIGPPNFPSYNLSTCNLPPINDLNHSASHLLPSPSNLAINHNPSLVISSPVNKVEKPIHTPFPFLCIRSVALNPPPCAIRNPLSQNKQPPAPDGIDLGWSRDDCRLASLSSLRPPRLCSAHALINPSCTATTCPMPHPSPDASLLCLSARGGRLRWSAQRRLLGSPAWPTRATPPPSGEPPF